MKTDTLGLQFIFLSFLFVCLSDGIISRREILGAKDWRKRTWRYTLLGEKQDPLFPSSSLPPLQIRSDCSIYCGSNSQYKIWILPRWKSSRLTSFLMVEGTQALTWSSSIVEGFEALHRFSLWPHRMREHNAGRMSWGILGVAAWCVLLLPTVPTPWINHMPHAWFQALGM